MNLRRNRIIVSPKRCPECGAQMHLKPTLLAWLTNHYRRVCTKCHYVDPGKAKI